MLLMPVPVVVWELGSTVSIMSNYGLDNRGSIRDRGREFFFSPLHPDQLWGPPSHLYNGYGGGSFLRDKAWPGCDADHSTPSSAEVKKE
jgi:hypothetical protein